MVSIVPCMMPRYAFLHVADLRLDAPFAGVGRTPPPIAAALRDASLQAWDALVETAIGRRVAAVLLSGGLCDGLERGARAQVRLRAGVARLVEHGIAVFIAVGSRDPQDGLAALGDWPEGVVVFTPGPAAAVPLAPRRADARGRPRRRGRSGGGRRRRRRAASCGATRRARTSRCCRARSIVAASRSTCCAPPASTTGRSAAAPSSRCTTPTIRGW